MGVNHPVIVDVKAAEDIHGRHRIVLHPCAQHIDDVVGHKDDATGGAGARLMVEQFTASTAFPTLFFTGQTDVAFRTDL